jgi:hypothetical protein
LKRVMYPSRSGFSILTGSISTSFWPGLTAIGP